MTELKNVRTPDSLNVLLIGDRCTDEYHIVTCDRISPEAPVPVIKIVESYTLNGMSSNVNLNLANLGINADFISNNELITKTRYVDQRSGQHMFRVDDEPPICQWSGRSPYLIESYNAIVISDYNKGFLSYENIESIIQYAKIYNRPVFIDTKKTDLGRFSADHVYVKINELEYKSATSLPAQFIITSGASGAMLTSPQLGVKTFGTNKVEVMDVCGCGDTFLAALVAEYLFTNDIEKSIIFANVAAGITVQHRGNYAPSYNEIKHARY